MIARLRNRLAVSEGFTLVEVLIAILLLSIAIIGTAATLDNTRKLTNTSEREEAAVNIAQREIELIRGLPYPALALTTNPPNSGSANNPNFYVDASVTPRTYDWDQAGTDATPEPLRVNGVNGVTGGRVVTGPSDWTDDRGRVRGQVYRYITEVNTTCPDTGNTQDFCSGTSDYRRITVAVTVAGGLDPKKPIVLSSLYIPDDARAPALGPPPCLQAQVDCK